MLGLGSLAARGPSWLREALALADPTVPNELLTDGVRATVDAYQGGHALLAHKYALIQQSGVAAQNPSLSVIALPSGTQGLLYGLHVNNYGGGGAAATVIFYIRPNATAGAAAVGQLTVANKAGSTTQGTGTLKDAFGSGAPIWLPDGCTLLAWTPATIAAQTVEIKVTWCELPTGFKPF